MPAQGWSDMRAAANSAASHLRFQDALTRMIAPAMKALARSAADHADHAVPCQRPVHSDTKSMRHRETIDEETWAGAKSPQDLVRSIESDLPLVPDLDRGGCAYPRDYEVLVRWLERQLLDEVVSASAKRLIRALAHALMMAVVGRRFGVDWGLPGETVQARSGRPAWARRVRSAEGGWNVLHLSGWSAQ